MGLGSFAIVVRRLHTARATMQVISDDRHAFEFTPI
jgi:hypothetical protein